MDIEGKGTQQIRREKKGRGYVGGGEKNKIKRCNTWVVEKKGKNNNNNNNIIIIKTESKNQNYVPNIIFFFLNYDFSCETKTMYQTEFFLQS